MTAIIDFKAPEVYEVYEEDEVQKFLKYKEEYEDPSSEKLEEKVELNPFTGQPRRAKNAGVSPHAKKRPNGHVRSQFNTVDHLVLLLLNSFRFMTIDQASQLLGVNNLSASKRLAGLKKAGLLRVEIPFGFRRAYCLTQKGRKELRKAELTDRVLERPTFKSDHSQMEIPHDLACMQIIVNELSGNGMFLRKVVNARFPRGLPTYEKEVHGPKDPFYRELAQVKIDWFKKFIVSDYTISYSYENANGRYKDKDALSPDWRAAKLKRAYYESLKQGKRSSVDTGLTHPQLFMNSSDGRDITKTNRYWTTDIAINFESMRQGVQPASYSVEVELSFKSHANLVKILNTYAASFEECPMFRRVVYVVHKKKRKTAIINAIEASDIDPKLVSIVTLENARGEEITDLKKM